MNEKIKPCPNCGVQSCIGCILFSGNPRNKNGPDCYDDDGADSAGERNDDGPDSVRDEFVEERNSDDPDGLHDEI